MYPGIHKAVPFHSFVAPPSHLFRETRFLSPAAAPPPPRRHIHKTGRQMQLVPSPIVSPSAFERLLLFSTCRLLFLTRPLTLTAPALPDSVYSCRTATRSPSNPSNPSDLSVSHPIMSTSTRRHAPDDKLVNDPNAAANAGQVQERTTKGSSSSAPRKVRFNVGMSPFGPCPTFSTLSYVLTLVLSSLSQSVFKISISLCHFRLIPFPSSLMYTPCQTQNNRKQLPRSRCHRRRRLWGSRFRRPPSIR